MTYLMSEVRISRSCENPVKRFKLLNDSIPIYESCSNIRTQQPLNKVNENYSILFCHAERWFDVYHRCHEFPFECYPVMDASFNGASTIYKDTALGIACRNFDRDGKNGVTSNQMFTTIKALYFASTIQIRCSQGSLGFTPLMDAITNPKASFELIQFLIEADLSFRDRSNTSLLRKDMNGLSPLDHLITMVHRAGESGLLAIGTIQYLVHKFSMMQKSDSLMNSCRVSSPLILLLSHKVKALYPSSKLIEDKTLIQDRRKRVTDCAKILLKCYPSLIHSRSVMSNCTPLHMAFRNNYGNQFELIELLLSYDTDRSQIKVRNKFGDFPIHVAISNGVSSEILKLLFQQIILNSPTPSYTHETTSIHQVKKVDPFIWSQNKKGLTPIHLAWMHHVNNKATYRTLRNSNIHNDGQANANGKSKYSERLSQAANEISSLLQKLPIEHTILHRERVAKTVLGNFWDFLLVYMRAIHSYQQMHFIDGNKRCDDEGSFYFLHAVCSLPRSFFGSKINIILFHIGLMVYPNEIGMKDPCGKTALHYAAASALFVETESNKLRSFNYVGENSQQPFGWDYAATSKDSTSYSVSIPIIEKVGDLRKEQLLKSSSRVNVLTALHPGAASVLDKMMCLPLHYAIESEKMYDTKKHSKIKKEWCKNIQQLLLANPEAIDKPSTSDRFFPFMQAALSANSSLDTLYHILRMAPNLVHN